MDDDNFIDLLAKIDNIDKLYSALKNSKLALKKKTDEASKESSSAVDGVKNKIKVQEDAVAAANIKVEDFIIQQHVDQIVESIKRKYMLVEAAHGSDDSSALPADHARQYGEYYNVARYNELLNYCKLAHLYEHNGIPEEHALKLSLMFDNTTDAIKYIKEKGSVHDACLFTVPDVENCTFSEWKKLFQKNRNDMQFWVLLSRAPDLERILNQNKAAEGLDVRSRKHLNMIKEMKKEIETNNKRFKELERKDADIITYAEMQERNNLNAEVLPDLLSTLYKMSGGIQIQNADLAILKACNEHYLKESQASYKYMLEHGLTKKDCAKFIALERKDNDEHIPNIRIDGATIGHPGTYLMKVPVMDEMHAARAACLGKLTDCCQSLSGEAGEPCTIHGLTSEYGGFYVVCEGDVNNPTVQDTLLGQSWAWRSKSNAIVFDSIELSGDRKDPEYLKKIDKLSKFYITLSKNLVDGEYTDKVACGADSGMSTFVGVSSLLNTKEEFTDYNDYCDSNKQLPIVERSKPFYLYDSDQDSMTATEQAIRSVMENSFPLIASDFFKSLVNWIFIHKKEDLIERTLEIAKEFKREDEFECIDSAFRYPPDDYYSVLNNIENNWLWSDARFENGNTVLMNSILIRLQRGQGKNELEEVILKLMTLCANTIDLRNGNGDTALHYAAQYDMKGVVVALLEQGANLEIKNYSGCTPLMAAVRKKEINIVSTLLEHKADINAKDTEDWTALHIAAQNGNMEVVLKLIENDAIIDAKTKNGSTPLSIAILYRHGDIALKLLESGADVNCDSKSGITLLENAITRTHPNPELVIELIQRGGQIGANVHLINDLVGLLEEKGRRELIPELFANIRNFNDLLINAIDKDFTNLSFELINHSFVNSLSKYGSTALMAASNKGFLDIVTALVTHKANVNVQNAFGSTALMGAVENEREDIVGFLINNGANVNLKDGFGNTALRYAIEKKHLGIACKLIDAGAKLDDADNAVLNQTSPEFAQLLRGKLSQSIVSSEKSGSAPPVTFSRESKRKRKRVDADADRGISVEAKPPSKKVNRN
ncbi:ankyrin repeat domain-containing protein [Candidatus Berkiella cookevillensis]|uniref:Ankyrin repeat domain-containing protein n=1 Tax=Candidatus Berkiella cookevillensis TaxID=437022 RepID=A0A0Q9YTI3_9GAMM|nr:ankyrin repeat domain-containing protein [Candidatus Berkiella cookevillensis]MCS5708265.1 ankyrin repeat domain-containing protein [Candidatus Berkiella cookevillensis]